MVPDSPPTGRAAVDTYTRVSLVIMMHHAVHSRSNLLLVSMTSLMSAGVELLDQLACCCNERVSNNCLRRPCLVLFEEALNALCQS
jgi:hypothetical protein